MFHADIHIRKSVPNICNFQDIALTTIVMVGISIVLFRGNLSFELNLIFIDFVSFNFFSY